MYTICKIHLIWIGLVYYTIFVCYPEISTIMSNNKQ